jgi:hypothetical protein
MTRASAATGTANITPPGWQAGPYAKLTAACRRVAAQGPLSSRALGAAAPPSSPAPPRPAWPLPHRTPAGSRGPAARTWRRRCPLRQQLVVAARLGDDAAVEDHDLVGQPHGAEAVADDHRDAVAGLRAQLLDHLELGVGVERGGGLVEHQHAAAAVVEPRQRQPLPLAARELLAAGEPAAQHLLEAAGQGLDEAGRAGAQRGLAQRGHVGGALDRPLAAADGHVLAHRHLVLAEVLEDAADLLLHAAGAEAPGLHAVQQDAPAGRLVEARHQLDERRLAGAVLPHQRQRGAAPHRERHALQHVALGERVAEADVLEVDPIDRPHPHLARVEVARVQLQEVEEVAHVEQVLLHAADALQQRLELALQLPDPLHEEAEVAHRQRPLGGAAQDRQRRDRDQRRRDERRGQAPAAAAPDQGHQLGPELQVVRPPALEQVALEAEQAHLLHGLVRGEEAPQVVLDAGVRRLPAQHAVVLGPEAVAHPSRPAARPAAPAAPRPSRAAPSAR